MCFTLQGLTRAREIVNCRMDNADSWEVWTEQQSIQRDLDRRIFLETNRQRSLNHASFAQTSVSSERT